MNKRDEYKRRHVHRWAIIEKVPAAPAGFEYMWGGVGVGEYRNAAEPMKLRRECSDCGIRSRCDVPDESVLVSGYEAVCDLDWKEEE